MKVVVTKRQFKILLDNSQLLPKGVGMEFTSDLLQYLHSKSKKDQGTWQLPVKIVKC